MNSASSATAAQNPIDPDTAGVPSDVMRTAPAGKVALMSSAPTTAPRSCASTYLPSVHASICLPSHNEKVTAGLMWPPEMGSMIVTMTASPTPWAMAMPKPALGLVFAMTLPAPTRTKSAVPMNSAAGARRVR